MNHIKWTIPFLFKRTFYSHFPINTVKYRKGFNWCKLSFLFCSFLYNHYFLLYNRNRKGVERMDNLDETLVMLKELTDAKRNSW